MSQKAIIYGATGGIGRATAHNLKALGYDLHLVSRSQEKLKSLAAELDCGFTIGDVLDAQTFHQVASESGEQIDALVYAVGSVTLRSLSRLTEADFLSDFRLNAQGAALAVQASLPALKRSAQASVLFFSSIAALRGFPLHASIGMAKGAIQGLTLSLAAELAPKIRVNAIAPSVTDTPLTKGLLSSEQMVSSLSAAHPIPRIGHIQDMAKLAAFLVSNDSSWMTGQIISVDGGRSSLMK
jgi:NAD(P)-dependent dehydrogenase (short-subunit alcohol dehydrogenase family)